jgi:hypothetical protein
VRQVLRCSLFVLSLGLVAGPALAAPAAKPPGSSPARPAAARVRDALRGDALAAFDRASELFADGDFGGARAEFERAHALSGEARVLYNVAVCDKALRRYARAINRLEESLTEGGGALPRTYVEKVHDTLALLAPLVTTLALTADEDGAQILVDDEPAGTTPLGRPIAVEVGEHVVTLRKAGFHDARARVEASSGAPAKLALTLEPLLPQGELSLRASKLPPGLQAIGIVDGAEVGPLPWVGRVGAGTHAVTVRARGFTAPVSRWDVAYKGHTEVDIDVRPDRHEGRLRVVAEGADIFLDDKAVGRGQFDAAVASGEHTVRVTRAGAVPSVTEVVVQDGETRSVSIQLASRSEIPAWVWIAGGVVLAGGATVAILLLTTKTEYQGSGTGTLYPGVVPASFSFRGP